MDTRVRGYDMESWIPAFGGMTKGLDACIRGLTTQKTYFAFMLRPDRWGLSQSPCLVRIRRTRVR